MTGRGSGLPRGMGALVAVAVVLLVLPLLAIVVRTPWADLGEVIARPVVADALRLSVVTAVVSALCCIVLGTPLAMFLATASGGRAVVVRSLVLLPLVLPPVVGGVALLEAFGRRGLLGSPLDAIGVRLPFTPTAVVLAQVFVALPFFVVTVEAGLRGVDARLPEAAEALGAGRWLVFRRITLPLIGPSLLAGTALALARALGEFGATITFAGNLGGRTQTMPLAVVEALRSDPDAALALSVVLIMASLVVLVGLRGRWLSGLRP